jgi:hypothetical protein
VNFWGLFFWGNWGKTNGIEWQRMAGLIIREFKEFREFKELKENSQIP